MRGLIEKDLRLTFARKQTLLIYLVIALIMGFSMERSFLIGYLTMLSMIIAVGTLSYDEYDNGFAFLMTLPFSRRTYVLEKYLFCLMISAAGWCAGVLLSAAGNIIRPGGESLLAELPMLAALIPTMYLSTAILIPLQLKYGSEKSRIALFIIFGVIAVLIIGAKNLAGTGDNPFHRLAVTLSSFSPAAVLLVLTAVSALIAAASCLLSIRIIEKKEF